MVCICRLPVRWDKTVIVVMDQVRVCSPYFPESVSGGTPAANERVRKVVRLTQTNLWFLNCKGTPYFFAVILPLFWLHVFFSSLAWTWKEEATCSWVSFVIISNHTDTCFCWRKSTKICIRRALSRNVLPWSTCCWSLNERRMLIFTHYFFL